MRFLFEKEAFYRFTALPEARFLFVGLNQSLPGRDAPGAGEAEGRFLAVAWFEVVQQSVDGIVVSPESGDVGNNDLKLIPMTVAEIARAAGWFPAVAQDASARDVELQYESKVLDLEIERYKAVRLGESIERPWEFLLTDASDIEDSFLESRAAADLTKMALARRIQRESGASEDEGR